MPRFNRNRSSINTQAEKYRDQLLPFLNPDSQITKEILTEGYCVLPSIISNEEVSEEYERMWAFISKIQPNIRQHNPKTWMKPNDGTIDPWPCAQRDMFQLHQAGWVFNELRLKIVQRVFEPLYKTSSLHVSKDGFTLQRPTKAELGRSPNDHFDQGSNFLGLHCIQGSVALTDQEHDDGCFSCWPQSFRFHEQLTNNNIRDFQILNDKKKNILYSNKIKPKRIPVKKGDVILWRSDLVHCGAPPIGACDHFRGVVYICALPAIFTPSNVYRLKVEAYEQIQTGCHWPNREEWFRTKKQNHKNGIQNYYDEPPVLSHRLLQLYGIIPYPSEQAAKQKTGEGNGGGGGGGETSCFVKADSSLKSNFQSAQPAEETEGDSKS